MRPGSNSTTACPRSREQHSARLNARPHKRVNVRKPFVVRARARFACVRDTMKVCLQITFACVIPFVVSPCVVRSSFLLERERARSLCCWSLDAKTYGLHYGMQS